MDARMGLQPITWMKYKYRSEKTRGRYKSSSNQANQGKARNKQPTQEQPSKALYMDGKGHKRMVDL